MTSGIPAFNNLPHDLNLSLNICQGSRPEIVKVLKIFENMDKQKIFEDVEVEYVELMKRCWDSNPYKRPTAEVLSDYFSNWLGKASSAVNKRIPVPGEE